MDRVVSRGSHFQKFLEYKYEPETHFGFRLGKAMVAFRKKRKVVDDFLQFMWLSKS